MNQFKYTDDVINMLKTFGERIRAVRIRLMAPSFSLCGSL